MDSHRTRYSCLPLFRELYDYTKHATTRQPKWRASILIQYATLLLTYVQRKLAMDRLLVYYLPKCGKIYTISLFTTYCTPTNHSHQQETSSAICGSLHWCIRIGAANTPTHPQRGGCIKDAVAVEVPHLLIKWTSTVINNHKCVCMRVGMHNSCALLGQRYVCTLYLRLSINKRCMCPMPVLL